ncbi:DUF302 domain-containing protein [Ruixingdingia sedimenti]|uniref:DUF302 domain-containing protein n=1 Tax=Ruixingdingia sedimenti TaxID=3073604 RepID=A0ABU1F7X7_9RHOB|nr:DUF302 domain-containing protein [Xinfangfangia sp. LG-4]MDR5652554.1 DUF302 domain-containing protein [Xinfangfangia sp. LG-4]
MPHPLIPAAALAVFALALPAAADTLVTRTVEGSFDEIAFAVENAILEKGLVIDSVSHVGDMLERTKADVGATATIFTKADVFQFCSATVSRKVMEADPMNIAFCPYGIYVYELPETPGQIGVAHREYPEGPMQEVQALLADIVETALK